MNIEIEKRSILYTISTNSIEFTSVERIISQYFLELNPPLSIRKLSKELFVSTSSISRFVKKIGLKNYKELLYLYNIEYQNRESKHSALNDISEQYRLVLRESSENYKESVINNVCELIYKKRIINIYGRGFNIFAANDIAFRFSKLGKFFNIIEDTNLLKLHCTQVKEDETIIVLTIRGNNKELGSILRKYKEQNINIVLITGNKNSPLIEFSTNTIITSTLKTKRVLGNVSPQLPMLIQLDLIYNNYISMYGEVLKSWQTTENLLQ